MKKNRASNSQCSACCFNFELYAGTRSMTDQTPCSRPQSSAFHSSSKIGCLVRLVLQPWLRAGRRASCFYLSCLFLSLPLSSSSFEAVAAALGWPTLPTFSSTCGCRSYCSTGNTRACSRSSTRRWIWRRGTVRPYRPCCPRTRKNTPKPKKRRI